jgi:hypothetical protein
VSSITSDSSNKKHKGPSLLSIFNGEQKKEAEVQILNASLTELKKRIVVLENVVPKITQASQDRS